MCPKLYLNLILLLFFATKVHSNEPSYFEQISNSIGGVASGYMSKLLEAVASSDMFSDEPTDNKYDYLHDHKFATPLLLEKCIKFHDSELSWINMSRLSGRWDRHLISFSMPVEFNYGVAEFIEEDQGVNFKYFPLDYYSLKYTRNDTKMIKSDLVVNEFLGIRLKDDEAMIGIDYDSYFLKHSCLDIMGKVSGSLHLMLRPEMTAQLDSNPKIFTQILNSIPEKSLIKISHLIPKLIHQNDKRFEKFGQNYAKTLTQRLDKYREDNQLSDQSDDKVFEFLDKTCAHFKEEELIIADLSTITHSNWTLDFTDVNNERFSFNRMTAQRLSNNTFTVSLFLGKKFLTDSDHYFDTKARGFWTYTEGMRSLEVTLYSTDEHRIIYSCEERHIDGKLQINEKLRYFSAELKTKRRALSAYLRRLTEYLKPHTLVKVSHLHKHMSSLKALHEAHPYHHDEL